MRPHGGLEDRIRVLLATDTLWLAQITDALRVSLVAAPFTPSRTTLMAELTLATFAGSAYISVPLGNQQAYRDPNTGDSYVQLREPIGGWYWLCSSAPAASETVVGYVVHSADGAFTVGTGLLDTPTTIAAAGDGVTIGSLRIRLPIGLLAD